MRLDPVMERRRFLGLLGGSAVARPRVARAQTTVPRVGVVHPGGPYRAVVERFREGLKQVGLEESMTLRLLVRDTRLEPKAIEEAVQGLVGQKVTLVYAVGTSVARPVKRAAPDLPVVFSVGTDPVAAGLVDSFANPGGRLTGVHYLTTDLTAKRLELLRKILPKVRRIVIFFNPDNPTNRDSVKVCRQMARQLSFELIQRHVGTREELQASVRALKAGEADAFFYVSDALVGSQTLLIIDTARTIRLPTMFHERTIAVQGALASYGVNYHEVGRLSAKYVRRIPGRRPAQGPARGEHRPTRLRPQPAHGQGARPCHRAVGHAPGRPRDPVIRRAWFASSAG